jgi:uncharacterized protein YvpB
MMLDYLNAEKLKTPEPELNEDRIAEIMNTTVGGTSFDDVENINKKMTKSNPSVEFRAEYKPHTLDDIRKELQKGLPVASWIDTGVAKFLHSVVIIGMDDVKKTISYNDPIYGEKTIKQTEFLAMWEKRGYPLMVKIEIGRISRNTLESFMDRGSSNGQS